jgi:hypothetical protein
MNLAEKIIEYENGNLTQEEVIELFQELYDTGIWRDLQGHYGRVMQAFIDIGVIKTSSTNLP